jgi:hypothetical protein
LTFSCLETLNSLLADLPSYEQAMLVSKASTQISTLNKRFPAPSSMPVPATMAATVRGLVNHAVNPTGRYFHTAQLLLELVECTVLKPTVLDALGTREVVLQLQQRLTQVWVHRQKSGAAIVALACHLAARGLLQLESKPALFATCKAACHDPPCPFTGTMLLYFAHFNSQWRDEIEAILAALSPLECKRLVTQMVPCEDCQRWLKNYAFEAVPVDARFQATHDEEVLEL